MSRRSGSDASRDNILGAAIECFATHGYQGASIDRIAKAAGVTKGALYYHFRDKEDLLFESVSDRIAEFESQVLEDTTRRDEPIVTLGRVLDQCFLTATQSNHRRFIITLMVEALGTNPRLSDAFRLELRRMRAFLSQVIGQGQRTGAVRSDLEPGRVAELIVATIMGAEIQHYQDPAEVNLRQVFDLQLQQLAEWLHPGSQQSVQRGERVW